MPVCPLVPSCTCCRVSTTPENAPEKTKRRTRGGNSMIYRGDAKGGMLPWGLGTFLCSPVCFCSKTSVVGFLVCPRGHRTELLSGVLPEGGARLILSTVRVMVCSVLRNPPRPSLKTRTPLKSSSL